MCNKCRTEHGEQVQPDKAPTLGVSVTGLLEALQLVERLERALTRNGGLTDGNDQDAVRSARRMLEQYGLRQPDPMMAKLWRDR